MCEKEKIKKNVLEAFESYQKIFAAKKEAIKVRDAALKFAYEAKEGGYGALGKRASTTASTVRRAIFSPELPPKFGDIEKLGAEVARFEVESKEASKSYTQALDHAEVQGFSWAEMGKWVGFDGRALSKRVLMWRKSHT